MIPGLFATIDPRQGDGWPETVVFLIVIGTGAYLMIMGREVPSELWGLMGLIVGYFVGHQATHKEGTS